MNDLSALFQKQGTLCPTVMLIYRLEVYHSVCENATIRNGEEVKSLIHLPNTS